LGVHQCSERGYPKQRRYVNDDDWYEEQQHEKLKLLLIIIGWSMSQYADPAILYERKESGTDEDDTIEPL
jgi:hypothetical protein